MTVGNKSTPWVNLLRPMMKLEVRIQGRSSSRDFFVFHAGTTNHAVIVPQSYHLLTCCCAHTVNNVYRNKYSEYSVLRMLEGGCSHANVAGITRAFYASLCERGTHQAPSLFYREARKYLAADRCVCCVDTDQPAVILVFVLRDPRQQKNSKARPAKRFHSRYCILHLHQKSQSNNYRQH